MARMNLFSLAEAAPHSRGRGGAGKEQLCRAAAAHAPSWPACLWETQFYGRTAVVHRGTHPRRGGPRSRPKKVRCVGG